MFRSVDIYIFMNKYLYAHMYLYVVFTYIYIYTIWHIYITYIICIIYIHIYIYIFILWSFSLSRKFQCVSVGPLQNMFKGTVRFTSPSSSVDLVYVFFNMNVVTCLVYDMNVLTCLGYYFVCVMPFYEVKLMYFSFCLFWYAFIHYFLLQHLLKYNIFI